MNMKVFFTVTLTLILAACNSANASVPTEMPTSVAVSGSTTTPTPAPTSLPTVIPTSIPEILPTPSSIVPFDQRLLASFEIFKEPDEMVFVRGYLWTKTADGHLVQIDPATNLVIADIKVDTTSDAFHYCTGLGTDGEHIWACSASGDADNRTIDVVRVDPESQSVVETFKVDKIFDQLDLPFLLNQIWVLSDNGTTLVGIDVTRNELTPEIDLGNRCFQLAVVGESLMATCSLDHVILQIDPEKREIIHRLDIKTPRWIAGDENGLWVAQDNAIIRLDPTSLMPLAIFSQFASVGKNGDIFITEDAVWIRQKSGFLYQIDPASNQIVEQIKIDQDLAGGSVLVTSDSIWATAYDNNLLVRLSLR